MAWPARQPGIILQSCVWAVLKHLSHLPHPPLAACHTLPNPTLAAWQMRVVRLHTGDAEERVRIKREVLSQPGSFDVGITTYDMVRVGG